MKQINMYSQYSVQYIHTAASGGIPTVANNDRPIMYTEVKLLAGKHG